MDFSERMIVLDDHIEQGRDWPAFKIIKDELAGMHKEVCERDTRTLVLEQRCDDLRRDINKLFVETRDLVKEQGGKTDGS